MTGTVRVRRVTWLKFTLGIFAELQFTPAPDSHAAVYMELHLSDTKISHISARFFPYFFGQNFERVTLSTGFYPQVIHMPKRTCVRHFGVCIFMQSYEYGDQILGPFWGQNERAFAYFEIWLFQGILKLSIASHAI